MPQVRKHAHARLRAWVAGRLGMVGEIVCDDADAEFVRRTLETE